MLGSIINGTFNWNNGKAWVSGLFLTLTQLQQDPGTFSAAITSRGSLGDAIVVGLLGAAAVWLWPNKKPTS